MSGKRSRELRKMAKDESRLQFTREAVFGTAPPLMSLALFGDAARVVAHDLEIEIGPPIDGSTQRLVDYLLHCRDRHEVADLRLPGGSEFHGLVVGLSQEFGPVGIVYRFTLKQRATLPAEVAT